MMQVPCPLVCSIIHTIDLENTKALIFEDKLITISEWKLLNAVYLVPHGTIACVAASNLTEACKYGKIIGKTLPCWPFAGHFPKGHVEFNEPKLFMMMEMLESFPEYGDIGRPQSPNAEIFFHASTD
jgi:hypothetical protein